MDVKKGKFFACLDCIKAFLDDECGKEKCFAEGHNIEEFDDLVCGRCGNRFFPTDLGEAESCCTERQNGVPPW